MTDWERWKYTIPEDMSRYRIPFLAWASPEQTTGKYTMVCPVCDTVMPEWNGDARRWTNIVPNYADLAPEFLSTAYEPCRPAPVAFGGSQ